MIEFNKIFCDLHPNELISNYCCHCTSPITKRNAILDSVPLVSALTLKHTSNAKQSQNTKISELPILKCKIHFAPEFLPCRTKKQELYLPNYLESTD